MRNALIIAVLCLTSAASLLAQDQQPGSVPVSEDGSKSWYAGEKLMFSLTVLGIFVSLAGAVLSWQAWSAAKQAGRIVKIQDAVVEIAEAIKSCKLEQSVSYEDVSERLSSIGARISRMETLFSGHVFSPNAREVAAIRDAVKNAQDRLLPLNPITGESNDQRQNVVYYTMEWNMGQIGMCLSAFQGLLENATLTGRKQ